MEQSSITIEEAGSLSLLLEVVGPKAGPVSPGAVPHITTHWVHRILAPGPGGAQRSVSQSRVGPSHLGASGSAAGLGAPEAQVPSPEEIVPGSRVELAGTSILGPLVGPLGGGLAAVLSKRKC